MLRSLVLAALVAAAPALAAAPAPKTPPPNPSAQAVAAFNLLDREDKGWVNLDDFLRGRPFAGRVFSVLDRNGDGVVDRREFLSAQGGSRAAEFARLDRAKDGRLTPAEFARGWTPDLFEALSGGRGVLGPSDLRPGLLAAAMPPAASPQPPPQLAEEQGGWRQDDAPCWIPLWKNHWRDHEGHWGMVAPWGQHCR